MTTALALTLLLLSHGQSSYQDRIHSAEEAKRKGDMQAMESSLQQALRIGAGDEYVWRSLAWAQMRQGKWRESLSNANENVRRNGKTSWSLTQLYESAMAAGDVSLAGNALKAEAELPQNLRNRDLSAARQQFRASTHPNEFDLTWRIKVSDYRKQKGELVINIPFREHLWQTAKVWAEGAKAARIETIDHRDVMFIDPGDAAELTLRAKVIHKPEVRGGSFGEKTILPLCPPEMKSLLGPFKNRIDYDPSDTDLQPIVNRLKGNTPAERVQAVLDWISANVQYVEGYPDDLKSILKNRKGVCHHQSNLMVSMCRAMGIPAFVAHGVSLDPGDHPLKDVSASHGWVEVYLNGVGWVGVEPLNVNSLRYFRGGYLIVDASGRGPGDDHFQMKTPDGRRIEGIQGVPVSGTSRILD